MKTPALFKEYIWLVNTIHRAKAITLKDINQLWLKSDMSGGVPLTRTTFYRHKYAIEEIFGLFIDCDRKRGNKYYIGNEEVLSEDSVQNWMLSTLSVSNMLDENASLHDRILLEQIPSGGELLRQIIKAMKESRRIEFTYHRYGSSKDNTFALDPYCVKLFRRRWYLLGRYRNGKMSVFSLDRMENFQMLETRFVVDEDFDAAEFFGECFGIVVGDGTKVERLVLRAYGTEANYLRDLPLHHGQREISNTDLYADFEFYMRPTSDFKGYLLSRGRWIEALEPQSLVDEIVEMHQDAINQYKRHKKS